VSKSRLAANDQAIPYRRLEVALGTSGSRNDIPAWLGSLASLRLGRGDGNFPGLK
jgi:hypothetical protein